jgi:hypothetical protein
MEKYPRSPFGQISRTKSAVLISLILWLWFNFTDLKGKLVGAALGGLFSGIEYIWFATTVELPDGKEVVFKPFDKNCRKGQTVSFTFTTIDASAVFSKCLANAIRF